MTTGGKSQGVYIVTDEELASGRFRLQSGPALKVSGFNIATRGVLGGLSLPVYIVNDVSAHGVTGGDPFPVVNLTTIRVPEKGLAIPVYVVESQLGSGFENGSGETSPGIPVLDAITNEEMDGDYTVNWDAVGGATSYELQEQQDGGEWSTVYAGANTFFDISGNSAGEWCYQVRAINVSGNSDFSASQCTTVNDPPDWRLPVAIVSVCSGTGGELINGNLADGWTHAAADPDNTHYVEFDMGVRRYITDVRSYRLSQTGGWDFSDADMYVSDDPENWGVAVMTGAAIPDNGTGWMDWSKTPAAKAGRYVRLEFHKASALSITEVQFMG